MTIKKKRSKRISPPAGLSPEARAFWRGMLTEYVIEDTAGSKILARACEALDRLRQAQRSLKKGVIVPDKKGSVKAHPAIAVEREAHRQFLEALRMLNLDLEPVRDTIGRPPGGH